jgi:hypothetical protein
MSYKCVNADFALKIVQQFKEERDHYHYQRNLWRECAEKLANHLKHDALARLGKIADCKAAIAVFNRLKEEERQ